MFRILVGKKKASELQFSAKVDVLYFDSLKIDDARFIKEDSKSLIRPKYYIIFNGHNSTTQAQNALLKLTEEPPNNCNITMYTEELWRIIPTLRSRAMIGKVDVNEDVVVSDKIKEHAKKVFNNIHKISQANVFSIIKHIDKEEYEQFLIALRDVWEEQKHFKGLLVLSKAQSLARIKSVNVERILIDVLLKLREVMICNLQS